MKKLTKGQLAETAARLMKAHKVKTIYATQDKNFFLKPHEANSHNRELNKNPQDIWEVVTFGEADAVVAVVADAVAVDENKTDDTDAQTDGAPATNAKVKAANPKNPKPAAPAADAPTVNTPPDTAGVAPVNVPPVEPPPTA